MSDKDVFTVRKIAKTWTSTKVYEILKNDKPILKLGDRIDADNVCEYLNKNQCKKSTGGRKAKKGSKTTKKSTSKKIID